MRDEDKTKEELIEELQEMRRQVCKLSNAEVLGQTDNTHGGSNIFKVGEDFTRVTKVEAHLQESIDTIEALLNATTDMVYLIDPDGTIIVANHRGVESLGGSHQKLIGASIFDFLPPKLATERREKLDEVIRLGSPLIYEDQHYVRHFEHSLYPILGKEGVQRIAVYSRDITDRKRAANALEESKEKYRRLIKMMNEGLWVQDENGIISYVNDRFCEMLGHSSSEMIGRRVADFLDKPNLEKLADRLDKGARQGAPSCEIEWSCKDGRRVWTIVAPSLLYDADGVFLGSFAVITDITERKRSEEALTKARDELEQRVKERTAELSALNKKLEQDIKHRKKAQEALRESEEKYRTVVEESFDGVFVQKGTGIVFANSRLYEMLGYALGELEGLDHWLVYHPDYQDIIHSRSQARLRGESVPSRYEVNLLRKDGTSFPGEVNAKVILLDNEPGIQVWIRDLTEQKLLQKGLFEAQKMETIGTLTEGIAHDFNNLLTIINGYAELALSENTEDDPGYPDLQKILETGRKGEDLVKRLLAFSKKAEINPQPLDLNLTVQNALNLMARAFPKMIEMQTIFDKHLSMVNADAAQVEQVLVNLCINAKEAMPDGGCLRIETKNMAVDEAYCTRHVGAKPGPHVLIEVSDTGSGMSKETIERMFDPFFTTKGRDFKKGTGLGLSVSKGIVEQHGGWIICQSEPGVGTTFTVYFPAIETQPEHKKPEIEATVTTDGKKILLVDDEEYVRDLGKRILERTGSPVITASNGEEALEIYAREHSSISLVILDLIMPQMSGEQCLEELLKINPNVNVIVATGHSLAQQERDRLSARAKGIVNKPYQLEHLLCAVKEALAQG